MLFRHRSAPDSTVNAQPENPHFTSITSIAVSSELRRPESRGSLGLAGFSLRLAPLLLVLISCTGGDPSDEANLASLEKDKEKAKKSMDIAEEAGAKEYFSETFEKAAESYEDAVELMDQGQAKKARPKFASARREFDRMANELSQLNDTLEGAKELKAEVEQIRRNTQRLNAEENAPGLFKDAEKQFQIASSQLNSKDFKKIQQAVASLEKVKLLYSDALNSARENKVLRENAVREKDSLAEIKAKVEEAQALKFAEQAYKSALDQEKTAQSQFDSGNFQQAIENFRYAGQAYSRALEEAIDNKRIADEAEALKAQDLAQSSKDAAPAEATPREDGGAEGSGTEAEAEQVKKAPDLSTIDGVIAEHIGKLLPSLAGGINRYDPVTNQVVLSYDSAETMKKDIPATLLKKLGSKYIGFKDPISGESGSGPSFPGAPPQAVESSFCFHGNTRGYFILPVPLTGKISIEYSINIMQMNPKNAMGPLLFSNEASTSTWWVDWLTFQRDIYKKASSRRAPPDKEKQKDANYWFAKTRTVTMRVDVAPDEESQGKKSKMTVTYDTGENFEPDNTITIDADSSGFVGFRWREVKFIVRSLRVTGELDKDAALKLLKEKGVQVGADSAGGETAPEEKEGAPAAPKSTSDKKAGPKPKTPAGEDDDGIDF